jgi:hypothetical protein
MPMSAKKLKHVERRLTDEERARHAAIRAAAVHDFPPKSGSGQAPSPPGIPVRLRQSRGGHQPTCTQSERAATNSGRFS